MLRLVAIAGLFIATLPIARADVGAADLMVSKEIWIKYLSAIKETAGKIQRQKDASDELVLASVLIQASATVEGGIGAASAGAKSKILVISNLLREYAFNLYPVSGKDDKETIAKLVAKTIKQRTPFALILGNEAFLDPWKTFREACAELHLPAPAETLL